MTPEQFDEIARVLPEPMLLVEGSGGRILTVNPPAARLLAPPGGGVQGRSLAEFVTDRPEQLRHYLETCARSGSLIPGSVSVQGPGGEPVPCRCEGAVVQPWTPQSEVRLLLRIRPKVSASSQFVLLNKKIEELGREIHERMRTEIALRESEGRFRTMADAAPVMIWMSGLEGGYTYFNRAWLDFAGRPEAEEAGTGWMERVHPGDQERCREVQTQAWESREPFAREFRLRRGEGDYRWVLEHAIPLFFEDGRFAGFIGSAIDIHEQKLAEQQLRVLNESLEERVRERTASLTRVNERLRQEVIERKRAQTALARANMALEQRNQELQDFAYVASHDLQEPLRKIRAFVELLQAGPGPEDQRLYLERIAYASLRMSHLITALLNLSRVSTQNQEFEVLDLNEIVGEVLSDLEVRVAETQGRVEVDRLCDLEADPLQMRQLFQNLIGNALKFHRPGVPPVVQVRATIHEDEPSPVTSQPTCQIEVEDNGVGFDERYLDRIFTPFQRLHDRSMYPGTGMGLAICRRIVERHGGTITASSTSGKGTTFVVRLPVRQARELEEQAETAA